MRREIALDLERIRFCLDERRSVEVGRRSYRKTSGHVPGHRQESNRKVSEDRLRRRKVSNQTVRLKEIIPVRGGPWQNPDPGFGEIDTVAHCGNTVEGLYANTVQYTDISLT